MVRSTGSGLFFVFGGNALRFRSAASPRLQGSASSTQGSGATWIFVGVTVVTSLLLGVA